MKKFLFFLLLLPQVTFAQCTFRNTAFQNGEYLTYNLYFNWKMVWLKAGTSSLTTVSTVYQGKPAYRTSLTMRGSKKADNYFVARDTLLSYVGQDMAPLYFRKATVENKRHSVDEVFYTYPGGKCHTRQHRLSSNGEHHWEEHTWQECVYDMLSIFQRARSFDPSNWKKGQVIKFYIVDGNSRDAAQLRYHGKSVVKADNGKRYRCLELSYFQLEKGKMKEIVRFYVTDDDNHIPVRLDIFLRIGAGKAFLTTMKGNRSPVTSEVK